jgi:ABC-type sulfate/molybdate transport systems ATPase subunit
VADNIRFGLRVARWRTAERELRVAEVLRVVGLTHRGGARIDALSASEQLTVAIARAIALAPRVLLLDEPLAGIAPGDLPRERALLRQLLQRLQLTVLLATADADDAMALGSNLAVMAGGQILQHGPTREVATRPRTADVARILNYVLLLEGRTEGDRINELRVGAVPRLRADLPEGRVQVFAHPAALLAVPAGRGLGAGVAGAVVASQPLGPLWQLQVALGNRPPLLVRWEWDSEPPAPGATVEIATPVTGLVCFSRPSPTVATQGARPPLPLLDAAPPRELAETG